MRTAAVYINIPVKSISDAFTYRIPENLDFLGAGWRVVVPFGRQRLEGFIVAAEENTEGDFDFALKDILSAVDEEPWFTSELIEIAEWLANFYLCSPGEIMRLFIPGKSGLKITRLYAAMPGEIDALANNPSAAAVYKRLNEKGSLTVGALQKQIPGIEPAQLDSALQFLLQKRLAEKIYGTKKRDNALREVMVVLNDAIDAKAFEKPKEGSPRRRMLEMLKIGAVSRKDLNKAGISPQVIGAAVKAGLVRLIPGKRLARDSYAGTGGEAATHALTEEQRAVMTELAPALRERAYRGFLLYGVTGSGKTYVYMEAAAQTRRLGRRVMVLVPEIALTGQVVENFRGRFGNDIIVIHSRLSVAERNDAVFRARTGEAGIIIGARSALFTPVTDIGLIILDEEQDASYKQDESPRYHAKVVARKLAETYGAVLLFASATPSLETYHEAKTGVLKLLVMKERVGGKPLPVTEAVDMRAEFKFGNRSILSGVLQKLIAQTLAAKQQMIIMLNRRGFSTFIMCRSCGEVIKCPECSMPLTYHQDKFGRKKLLCHHCDLPAAIPDVCPVCGSRYIKYFGSGTEKLEQELATSFPGAKILRMDRDTTTAKFAHQEILHKFKDEKYDILLGTQMVAKGHDIPGVTAVGILSADAALNIPDFRAAERTFMLITQTAGRAGRGDVPGRVVVQCYSPEHFAVQCGLKQDYDAFYATEAEDRRELNYPPYSRLIKLIFHHADEETAKKKAADLAERFRQNAGQHQEIMGPSPALMARLRGEYRFVVLIKSNDLDAACAFLRRENLHRDSRVTIDIDPINTI